MSFSSGRNYRPDYSSSLTVSTVLQYHFLQDKGKDDCIIQDVNRGKPCNCLLLSTKDKRRINEGWKLAFTSLTAYISDTKTEDMAQSKNSVLLHQVRGQIGKQLVVKQYGKKTVITAYPDMSNVKPSKAQKVKRKRFAEAVAYAQGILHDPVKKKAYALKLKKGQSVYHSAIKEWLGKN